MKELVELVMLGASTAFYEISNLIEDINRDEKADRHYRIISILDDNAEVHGERLDGLEIAGGLDMVKNYPDAKFVFGIGSIKTQLDREKIIERISIPEDRYESLIHPSVIIYKSARIGHGCIIHSGNKICHEANIGSFVVMTYDAVIGNFVNIDKFCMIANKSIILSNTTVEKNVYIGSGCIIGENIKIGFNSVIGMGTIIRKNVPENTFIIGNPPRKISLLRMDNMNF